jgi:hypothetical protein
LAAAVDPSAVIARLVAAGPRPACSNGERLAARQATRELRALGRRGARTQTEWVRPAGTLVAAAIAAAGVAASVLAVDHPQIALALAGAALLLLMGELSGRAPVLTRLTYARATQNVVSAGGRPDAPVRLVVTAALDTPRAGLLDGDGVLPRATARLRRRLRGHLPGRYGVLIAALVAVGACAGARAAGVEGRWLGGLQLAPTLALLGLAGLLTDAGTARAGRPGAGANASAAAVALALVAALDRRPPRALAVDLVLAGAGEAGALGMRRWVREQRRAGVRGQDVAVLHIGPCAHGTPVWWTREGRVLALRYHPQLTAAAARVAAGEAHLRARPHQTRGTSGARVARAAGWPAIAVGCVGPEGTVPRAGRDDDTPEHADPAAMNAALSLALGIVAALDADLAAAGPSTARMRDSAARPATLGVTDPR